MATLGPIHFPIGIVYCSCKPTENDKTGCDGLYVDRVDVKPFKEWPMGYKFKIGMRMALRDLKRLAKWWAS